MRMPAYARQLLEARARGEEFWLAVIAIGWLRDGEVLRGLKGVARIGCPSDADPARLDWRAITGMDVLVTNYAPGWPKNPFALPPPFWRAVLAQIWRARPATVWQETPGNTATRLMHGGTGAWDPYPFVSWGGKPSALDASLREAIRSRRDLAFILAEEPFFNDPQFDGARQAQLDRWAA